MKKLIKKLICNFVFKIHRWSSKYIYEHYNATVDYDFWGATE